MRYLLVLGFAFVAIGSDLCADDTAAELRAADLEAERVYLEKRLKAVPDSLPALRTKLKEVRANHGITGLGLLMRLGEDIDSVIDDAPVHQDAVRTLNAFNQQLKRQGVDLIVMPVPNQVMTYAHRLSEDIPADANVWPGYTRGLIGLIDADVEVLDLSEAFATYDGKDLALQPGDHHWASRGMAIAAQKLAARLDRYPHLAEHRDSAEHFEVTVKQQRAGTSLIRFNKLWNRRKKRGVRGTFEEVRVMAGLPKDESVTVIEYKGKLTTPPYATRKGGFKHGDVEPNLFVGGDSQVFHRAGDPRRGAGFPNHLGKELGRLVGHYGRSGAASMYPQIYAEHLANMPTKPKVLVMVFRAGPLSESTGNRRWRVPVFASATSKSKQEQLENLAGERTMRLAQISEFPDPSRAVYEDAIVEIEATIIDGKFKGTRIRLMHWAMKNRKLDTQARAWKAGDEVTLSLAPWKKMLAEKAELGTIMRLDSVEDLHLPAFWGETTH